jgi:hypothetical protein
LLSSDKGTINETQLDSLEGMPLFSEKIFKNLTKNVTEISTEKKIIKRISFLKNIFRSLLDFTYIIKKKNRDNNIVALIMSLKIARYNLSDRENETIRIIIRKIDK